MSGEGEQRAKQTGEETIILPPPGENKIEPIVTKSKAPKDVEKIEPQPPQYKREDCLTKEEREIERILGAGSTYYNLNPFHVLHLRPTAELPDIRRQFRLVSRLVHPDKNPNDVLRAQQVKILHLSIGYTIKPPFI